MAMTDKSIRGLCDQGGGRGPGTGRGAPLQAMTSPGAAALITERGDRLYVWVTKFHCCGGAVRIVCSSPGAPRRLAGLRRQSSRSCCTPRSAGRLLGWTFGCWADGARGSPSTGTGCPYDARVRTGRAPRPG